MMLIFTVRLNMKTSLRCFCEEERQFCQESHQEWMDLHLSRYEKCFSFANHMQIIVMGYIKHKLCVNVRL